MKGILLVAFGVLVLLDFFLVIVGIGIILTADSTLTYLISIAIALILTCLRLSMEPLFRREGALYRCLQGAFAISILVAFFAIGNALVAHVLLKHPLFSPRPLNFDEVAEPKMQFKVLLMLVGLFLGISPMFLSYLIHEYISNEEEEMEDSKTVKPKR